MQSKKEEAGMFRQNETVTFDQAIAEVLGADGTDTGEAENTFFRHRIDLKERADVMRRVFLDSDPRWLSAFIVMLLLATAIASFGLSEDSAATVLTNAPTAAQFEADLVDEVGSNVFVEVN